MRRKNMLALCLIAMFLMTIMTGIGTSTSTTTVHVVPPEIIDPTKGDGSEFSVDVNVTDCLVKELYGWSIRMTFDPNVVNVKNVPPFGVTYGDFLATSGEMVVPLTAVIDNTLGYVFFGQVLFYTADNGATGSGTLATVNFTVTGRGVTSLDLGIAKVDTKLNTIISGTSVPIDHVSESGSFDNRMGDLEPPVADFTYAPTAPLIGETVTFNASASSDPDGYIVSYEWSFSDGTTEIYVEGVNLTDTTVHAFASAGTLSVTLNVTDNDGLWNTTAKSITVLSWMAGGSFPDLVDQQAWPEMPRIDEPYGIREMDLYGKVGNPIPTGTPYEVYVEFMLYSKDEAKLLGTLTTDPVPLDSGETVTLSSLFDTADNTWRCFSGSPEWAPYGYVHWFLHKYAVFASCYYKNSTMSDFEKGNVAAYFGFCVAAADHDIAIEDVTLSAKEVLPGGTVGIDVTVANYGDMNETVDLTVDWMYEWNITGSIGAQEVTIIAGETTTLSFTWDTSGLPTEAGYGPYLIMVNLPFLAYEKAIGDNAVTEKVFIVDYSLVVKTEPVAGEVFVGKGKGKSWGTAPQSRLVDPGTYTVSFGDVWGYYTPDPITATVTEGQVTTVTGVYEPKALLTVNTMPVAGDVTVNGDFWGLANQTRGVEPDTYTVSFGDVWGYYTPDPITVTVTEGGSATVTGIYEPKAWLTVETEALHGAKPVYGPVYVNGTIWGLAPQTGVVEPGTYNVSFGLVADYYTPDWTLAIVTEGNETIVTGYYELISYLHITTKRINYAGVFTPEWVGGQVFVNGLSWGTASPNQSRPIVPGGPGVVNATHITPGDYTISFGEISGYVTPDPIDVTITEGASLSVTGEYVPITGNLTVRTEGAIGKVYVNDVSWGFVDPLAPLTRTVLVGTYGISFGRVPGYVTPDTVAATVEEGLTAVADPGVYVPE